MNRLGALMPKYKIARGIFLLFLILLTLLPRLLSLSAHWAADEDLWMKRSRDFFFALESGQFEDTLITHHPGVTTCWLGSLAIWYASQYHFFKSWFRSDQFLSPSMLALVRFPIALTTGILILMIGILLYRLYGKMLAGIGTLFLSIEPFLLSESRRAHTDALTALFLFLALLLWLCYLENRTRQQRDLVFSGICFGLACLTKSHAGAFLFFLPIILALYSKKHGISWMQLLMSALLWGTATVLTVTVVWPYLWTVTLEGIPLLPFLFCGSSALLLWSWRQLSNTSPCSLTLTECLLLGIGLLLISASTLYVFSVVISRMYDALTTAHEVPTMFLGDIRYNPGLLYFPIMWFIWTGLVTLPLIGFAIYSIWKARHKEKKLFRITLVLVFFIVFYLVGLSCVSKKISRYLVIYLPAVSLLTAIGTVQFVQQCGAKANSVNSRIRRKKQLGYLILFVIFLIQAMPILRLHPNYRTYYYPFLSGKWVAENTSSITGAGLDLAANYLNALPNSQHLQIRLTWFSKDLAHYFVGEMKTFYNDEALSPNFDYDVEYLYDKQIQGVPVENHPYVSNTSPRSQHNRKVQRELEHVVCLNGIDYVWIYRVIQNTPEDIQSTLNEHHIEQSK